MKCFVYLLCLIQIIYSNSMYIPNIDVFNIINNASKQQDLIQIEKIFDKSSAASIKVDETNFPAATGIAKSVKAPTNFIKHWPTLIAIVIGVFFLILLLLTICCCCIRRCRREKRPEPKAISADLTHASMISSQVSSQPTEKPKSPAIEMNNLKCPYMLRAKEYVRTLGWKSTLFDSSHDKCYCKKCYPAEMSDVTEAGNAEYVIPRGWARIGLFVDLAFVEQHSIWDEWIVTFHGTTIEGAHSIIVDRQFLLPGDTLRDGTVLGIREGHIPNKKHVYTSPTIAYSSLDVYSVTYPFHSKSNIDYDVKIVLQCRQQPGTFTVQGETVAAGTTRLCRHVSNEKIEYFTDRRSTIVAYGLLVRLVKTE